MPVLLRPEGPAPTDLAPTRRGLAALAFGGYAAAAFSADAEPIHTDEQGLVTGMVEVPESGGALPAYVARPEAKGRYAAVIVVSEVFGLHEYIRDVCRRFAKLGYVAIAPAFFVRADPEGELAKTTDFGKIQKIVATASNAQVMGDVGATLDWLKSQPFVDKDRLAITGFCWGGAVVWMASARFPEIKAGVAWYGRLTHPPANGFLGGEQRPWPADVAGQLHAPVLGLYAGQDKGIPPSDIAAMRAALKAAGRSDEIIVYPEAQHGFHADYRETYDAKAAQDGWTRMLAHFRAHHAAPGAKRGLFG